MSLITIKSAGPGITLQDGGRRGFLRFGVTGAGPMDPLAFAVANLAVGNHRDATAIEVSAGGITISCKRAALDIAVAGGEFVIRRDGKILPSALRLTLIPGETLEITAGASGNWCYLAIGGRVDLDKTLGSHATHTRTSFGGIEGRPLQAGDEIPIAEARSFCFNEGALIVPSPARSSGKVRVIAGPQRDYFADDQFHAFLTQPWTVSMRGDRMATFLEGLPLTHAKGYNIVSDGIAHEAIQVPGEGLPIVLMADRQPTGGYPKIANVITADIGMLAQMRGGKIFHFEEVTHAAAVEALRATETALTKIDVHPFTRTSFTAEFFDKQPLLDGIVDSAAIPEGLTPTERIALLFDQDSVESREVGTLVVAQGKVFGRPVMAYARGTGALDAIDAAAIAELHAQAAEIFAIVVALHDGAALQKDRLAEGLEAVAHIAEAGAKRKMPELALVFRQATGADALLASLADLVFTVGSAELMLAGPELLQRVIGVAKAEADTISSQHFTNEVEAIASVRRLIDLLPDVVRESAAFAQPWPSRLDVSQDIREMVGALADHADVFELQPASASGIVTAIVRLGGLSCGILANQLGVNGGAMDVAVLRKATGFVRLCSRFSIPLLHLAATPGILPGHDSLAASRDLLRALLEHEAGGATLELVNGSGLLPAFSIGPRVHYAKTKDTRMAILAALTGGML